MGCIKFTKDILAPSSLTGKPITIKTSRNIQLKVDGTYRINGKILKPDESYQFKDLIRNIINTEIDYNPEEIQHNLDSFQNIYTQEIPLPSRKKIPLSILSQMNQEFIQQIPNKAKKKHKRKKDLFKIQYVHLIKFLY